MARWPAQGPPIGGGGGHIIEDEGVALAKQVVLNYVGNGVTATDLGGKTVVDIPGTGADTVIGRQTIFFPASAMYAGITTPALPIAQRNIGVFNQQLKYIPFPSQGGDSTLAYMDWFPPQNWVPSTFFTTVYWTSEFPSTAGRTIDFQITALGRNQNNALGGADDSGIASTQTVLTGVDELQIDQAGGSGVVRTGSKGAWVQFKLRRKSSTDNLQGELQVIGIKIRYSIDKGTSEGLS